MAAVAPHGVLLGLEVIVRVRGAYRPGPGKQLTVPDGTDPVNSCSRMKSVVDLSQTRFEHMSVNLRGRQVRVAEHGLNGAQIGATLEQIRREGMTEHVRAQRRPDAGRGAVLLEELPEADARQAPAVTCVDEEPRAVTPLAECATRSADVPPNPLGRFIAERHDALLVSL